MLKEGVDKIDVGKLEIVPADLSKLNNVVDNDVVKNLCIKNWSTNSMQLILRNMI